MGKMKLSQEFPMDFKLPYLVAVYKQYLNDYVMSRSLCQCCRYPKVRIGIIVLGDQNASAWSTCSESSCEVSNSLQTVSVEHIGILRRVDLIVDGSIVNRE